MAKSEHEPIRKLLRWKNDTDSKGLKVNMNKTRVTISGERCKAVQNMDWLAQMMSTGWGGYRILDDGHEVY